jgi:hypothetical protein
LEGCGVERALLHNPGMIGLPDNSPTTAMIWWSWILIGIPFVAGLVLVTTTFAAASHQDFSSQYGRITAVRVWSDEANCLQMDLDLEDGKFVSIDDCGAGPTYVLNPRPMPSDFEVGDHVTAINYAGSATDLILDHNGNKTHYTTAYYEAHGTHAALQEEQAMGLYLEAGAAAIGLCMLIALGRAVWLARAWGSKIGAASFLAVTTLAPYLGLAGLSGTSGGTSESDPLAFGLLIASSLVGLPSAIGVWAISSAAARSELSQSARDELRRLGILTTIAAAGWLLAGGGLLVTLAILGTSCCG